MRHSSHFVETFDSREDNLDEAIGRRISLSSIEPDPNQPRSAMGDLSDLVRSIQKKGVLEPILVRANPDLEPDASDGAPFRIISGERRYRAAQEAGLAKIPVIELEVSEQEALEIALIENLQRKDLTPFEEAEGYQALAEQYDYTHEQIADAVGKSRTVVTESFALLQLPVRVRNVAQALNIQAKSLLLEILKAEDEEEMIYLLEAVNKQGLNRDDLRQKFRKDRFAPAGKRKKQPYVFKFRAPDKTYNLSLTFRQSTVEKHDLIQALENILNELREQR